MEPKSSRSSSKSSIVDWSGPHTVVIPRGTQSDFGFTLRHLVVYPPQSALGDIRNDHDHLSKGSCSHLSRELSLEPQETIFVKSVREGSPAYYAGLNTGDRVLAVNGISVSDKSYRDVIATILQSGHTLRLLVVPQEDDILQLAYEPQASDCSSTSNSSLSDSVWQSGVNKLCKHRHSSVDIVKGSAGESFDFGSNNSLRDARCEIRHSYPLSLWGQHSAELQLEDFSSGNSSQNCTGESLMNDNHPSQIATDTACLSQQQPESVSQDLANSMTSNITYNVPSRSRYSFGLYFPPKTPTTQAENSGDGDCVSAENLDKGYEGAPDRQGLTKSQTFEISQKRPGTGRKVSLEENSALSSSARSRDFFIRYSSDKAASDNRNRYSPRYSTYERYSNDNRPTYIISRSQTVSTLSPSSYSSGYVQSSRKSPEYMKSGQVASDASSRTCQYIPIISESKQQTSAVRGENRAEMGGSTQSPLCSIKTDLSTGSRTFVLSIPCGGQQAQQQSKIAETRYTPERQTFGTAAALIRSSTAAHSEIQKSIGKPIVSQRKYQFESKNEHTPPPSNDGNNQYKSEIEQIRTRAKFSSIAMRKASFEQSPDRDPPGFDDLVEHMQTPTVYSNTNLETVNPTEKVRLFSAEKYNSGSSPQLEDNSKSAFINGNKDNTSIRIFVSTDKNGGSMTSVPVSSRMNVNQPAAVENVSKNVGLDSFKDGRFASSPSIMGSSSISSSVGGGESGSCSGLADSGVWVKSYLSSSDMLDEADGAADQEGSGVRTSEFSDKTNNSAINVPTHRSFTNSISSVSTEGFTSMASSAVTSHSDRVVTTGPAGHGVQKSAGPDHAGSVAMRKKLQDSLEDQTNKLHRRTSYLMATARDRTNAVPLEETFSASQDAANQKQNSGGTARRNSAVKLNKFFGEMIPSIAEGTEGKPADHEEPPEIIRKGPLSCKISTIEGKKCSDRSWKSVYAILRPTELFLTRDKEAGSASSNFEDQHIPLKSCTVEFAREYAKKKKNVFRLSTQNECDYLFQTDDRGMLMCWIQGIKSVSETERAEKEENQTAGKGPIEINIIPSSKTSPLMSQKSKKLSALSFKSKLTASPNMKRKKSNATEKDKEENFKKGWKDRIPMMKSLKKHSEYSNLLSTDQDVDTDKFQFGIPMEYCFPSPHNEYVPLIVELCTRIVEARGLEVVGVYRVPGNSAAVTALTEEFNRGIDSVNIDNEKLLDINVISSLLKSFFRKLPEPLIPTDMYEAFIEANRYPDEDKRKLKIKRLLHLLPAHHNETLKRMAEHLNKVASYGNINKMDAKNLAIMFGPTLVRKKGDDTVSLVTDMSDQCRIVESIILHHEWFFSPWDQDSYIPMETTVETVPVDGVQNLSKDDDEEADSAISTKEIISSIVGAASKKLRQQQQKSTESLDMVDSGSVASVSSSRDHNMSQPVYLPSFAKSLASINSSLGVSEEFLGSRTSVPSTVYLDVHQYGHNTSTRSYFPELDYAGARTPSSGHSVSDDYLEDKNDELEISHGLPTSLSQDAINRLKRIEEDVSALLHTFEQKQQKERERRKREQELVEREHFRTQLELEQEDSHSVEDWLSWEAGFPSLRMPDLVSSSYTTETSGQGYSGTDAATRGKKEIPDKKKFRRESKLKVEPSSHTSANVASISPQVARLIPAGAQQCRICRRGSHEEVLSHSRKPVVISKPSQQSQDSPQKTMHLTMGEILQSQLSPKNSQGRRGGSLDSLIDKIDKQDKRISWASTDSEDGSDLLTSITATFDQKLEILLNPKYKLTGAGKKNSKSSNSSGSTNEGNEDRDATRQMKGIQTVSPLSPKQTYTVGSLLEPHRAFRDPSLHRTARSDPKIGIASRFERNDIGKTTSSSPIAASALSTTTNVGQHHRDETVQTKTLLNESPSQVNNHSHVPSDQSKSRIIAEIHLNDRPTRNVSESDKTDQNEACANFSQKLHIRNKDMGNEDKQIEEPLPTALFEKNIYRRHSVGGIEDFVHNNTLSQLYGKTNTRVCSAFGYKLPVFKPFQLAMKHPNTPGSLTLQA